jgi:hypothetical protein
MKIKPWTLKSLPSPKTSAVEVDNRIFVIGLDELYRAYADNDVIGRCVRIGHTEDGLHHYHWAIAARRVSLEGVDLLVDEFWSDELWTTEDYRGAQRSPLSMEPFQTRGVPSTWRSQFGGYG